MMRSNAATSMQKTYDDCFLVCSTAVYFENKNNEAEALRSWKNALDQIYYHNAYRLPANYRPKTETEKALLDSLKQMELQCKERVDLLEALKQSREEAAGKADGSSVESSTPVANFSADSESTTERGWLGSGTVPPLEYPDLTRPPLPKRPTMPLPRPSGSSTPRSQATTSHGAKGENDLGQLSLPQKVKSRTPSPDKRHGMLKTLRPGRKMGSDLAARKPRSMRQRPPAAAKAATQAWEITGSATTANAERAGSLSTDAARSSVLAFSQPNSAPTVQEPPENLLKGAHSEDDVLDGSAIASRLSLESEPASGYLSPRKRNPRLSRPDYRSSKSSDSLTTKAPQALPTKTTGLNMKLAQAPAAARTNIPAALGPPKLNPPVLSYRREYLGPSIKQRVDSQSAVEAARRKHGLSSLDNEPSASSPAPRAFPKAIRRKAVNTKEPLASTTFTGTSRRARRNSTSDDFSSSSYEHAAAPSPSLHGRGKLRQPEGDVTPPSDASEDEVESCEGIGQRENKRRSMRREANAIIRKLPKGVDEAAARQVLNEVVTKGDEVHWEDIAGLEPAKNALKETVVYPFLRPDLFSGLREPARGMLLFGPPGTGKTMLARAVATESRSTFFAISASSLVSKWMGESEKLVRALFALAKVLAPSIIFVDEIDSLLGSRGGASEHEATRRVKTEFLIQWSDLQRAAAGRESKDAANTPGDPSRVLVLAATNLPWAIDEAARRRFVRRQYIPLPEPHVRETQLRTLLSHQKNSLSDRDIARLVQLTDGFSGSDITALAKDAAMGPLRALGERLLEMNSEDIRPIGAADFEASLASIRPSVSREGLMKFEEWARVYGERAG